MDGNVFGGFTPLEWEWRAWNHHKDNANNSQKCNDNVKSFLFTRNDSHNTSARKFALKAPGSSAQLIVIVRLVQCLVADRLIF
jgi:hypothetical protein